MKASCLGVPYLLVTVKLLVFTLSCGFELYDIVDCGFGNILKSFFGEKRLMGGYYDVWHRDQSGEGVVLHYMS